MPKIVIGEVTIDFPKTGADPAWSPSIIQFAETVAEQFLAISSNFDVPPSVLILTNNVNTDINLDGADFNSVHVSSFNLTYTIYRKSSTTTLSETGNVVGTYNGVSWDLEHSYSGERQSSGQSYHTFTIDSQGQVKLTTASISGVYDDEESKISYSAKTLLTGV